MQFRREAFRVVVILNAEGHCRLASGFKEHLFDFLLVRITDWLAGFDQSLVEVRSHGIAGGVVASNTIDPTRQVLDEPVLRKVCNVFEVTAEVGHIFIRDILNDNSLCCRVDCFALLSKHCADCCVHFLLFLVHGNGKVIDDVASKLRVLMTRGWLRTHVLL